MILYECAVVHIAFHRTVIQQCVVIDYGTVLHCMILMPLNWVSDCRYAVKIPPPSSRPW